MMIVIVAIGIVSVTVLPVFNAQYQQKQVISQVRKSYAVISTAFKRAIAVNGAVYNWDVRNAEDMFNILRPYLKIKQECGIQTNQSCIAHTYGRLNNSGTDGGDSDKRYYKSVLTDGSSYAIRVDNAACNIVKGNNEYLKHVCGIVFIDINGLRKPNVAGKDKFEFYITSYGVYPRGSMFETSVSRLDGPEGCSNMEAKGYGCSAWVISKGNMDYLYDTVSW